MGTIQLKIDFCLLNLKNALLVVQLRALMFVSFTLRPSRNSIELQTV